MAERKSNKRHGNFKDLTGQRFNRLLVVGPSPERVNRFVCWYCICDCGIQKTIRGLNLTQGRVQSCGCLNREKMAERRLKHGHWGSSEYWTWALAKNRCTNSKNKQYRNYGGRGIQMSTDWLNSFAAFLHDMGNRPDGYQLDRIDNDGNYCKENCRWATPTQQMRNTRVTGRISHNGQVLSFAEWSEITGIGVNTLRGRYFNGKRPPELFDPVRFKYSPIKK